MNQRHRHTERERERERREAKVKSTWKEDRKKTFARRYLAIRTVAELLLQRHLYSGWYFAALYDRSYSLFIITKRKYLVARFLETHVWS